MEPTKKGQIVKFKNPLPDEDPNQLYVVTQISFDVEKPRADIKPYNTDLNFPPINTVFVKDLEYVKEE